MPVALHINYNVRDGVPFESFHPPGSTPLSQQPLTHSGDLSYVTRSLPEVSPGQSSTASGETSQGPGAARWSMNEATDVRLISPAAAGSRQP